MRPLNCKERDKDSPDYCNYKECTGKEWFDFQDIKYCGHQIIWVIKNLDSFEEDCWPLEPSYDKAEDGEEQKKTSSYTDAPINKRSIRSEAYFVKTRIVLGEVKGRLKRTGRDGEWLVTLIQSGWKENELPFDPKMAFYYITGYHRYGKNLEKWQNYSGWKKQRVYRSKK